MDIKTFKEFLKTKLQEAVARMSANIQIPVLTPPSIDDFNLSHPIGSYLIIYKGSSYRARDLVNFISQDRDLEYWLFVVARYRDIYTPEQYLDYAIRNLSGVEISNIKINKKIYCKDDELVGEEGGIWTYAATIVVPGEFIEGNNE